MDELTTQSAPIYMSAQINEIAAALSAFQGAVKQPSLNKTVKGSYTFHYADFSECKKSAAPELAKNGLAVTQLLMNRKLVTLLTHKSGQWFQSELPILEDCQVVNKQHQQFGSSLTYLKRYAYCAILGIVADDDDDANIADNTGNTDQTKKEAAPAKSPNTSAAMKALAECKTPDEVKALFLEWKGKDVTLTANGTEFYNGVADRIKQLSKAV